MIPEEKASDKLPEKPMPEYRMFPDGMWHLPGAVMLMVVCLPITVMLISGLVEGWFEERTLMYLELAVLAGLALILSTATFLLSRGWSVCHRFLLWHNRAYLLIISAGTTAALLAGHIGMAVTGFVGLGLALIAHQLYRSEPYGAAVEHYRLIWEDYRSER